MQWTYAWAVPGLLTAVNICLTISNIVISRRHDAAGRQAMAEHVFALTEVNTAFRQIDATIALATVRGDSEVLRALLRQIDDAGAALDADAPAR